MKQVYLKKKNVNKINVRVRKSHRKSFFKNTLKKLQIIKNVKNNSVKVDVKCQLKISDEKRNNHKIMIKIKTLKTSKKKKLTLGTTNESKCISDEKLTVNISYENKIS